MGKSKHQAKSGKSGKSSSYNGRGTDAGGTGHSGYLGGRKAYKNALEQAGNTNPPTKKKK